LATALTTGASPLTLSLLSRSRSISDGCDRHL